MRKDGDPCRPEVSSPVGDRARLLALGLASIVNRDTEHVVWELRDDRVGLSRRIQKLGPVRGHA
jgi:hypothetical protein